MAPQSPAQYKDPVITKYIELIKSYTNAFKMFYYGDPIRVPVSSMPALIVSKVATDLTEFTNAEDEHNMQIVFTVITDIRKDISDEHTIVPGISSLYYLLEGRDPSTLQLNPDSLANILRHNVDLYQNVKLYTDVGSKTKISYNMTIGKRQEDMFGIEGSITIIAKLVQLR